MSISQLVVWIKNVYIGTQLTNMVSGLRCLVSGKATAGRLGGFEISERQKYIIYDA